MTAPPKVHNPDAVLEKQEDLGYCNLITDATRPGDEVVCGTEAVEEIVVRNKFGLFVVPLCKAHKAEHRKFYDELRRRQGRRVHRSHNS